jgi:hypothetical protein
MRYCCLLKFNNCGLKTFPIYNIFNRRILMKKLIGLLLLINLVHAGEVTEVLLLDSSFPPIKSTDFSFAQEACPILTESNLNIPESGQCFDDKSWKEMGEQEDEKVLKGLMDSLAKVSSADVEKYNNYQKLNPDKARVLRGDYILATHGTRSAFVLNKYAEGKVKILPMRVVSAQAGTVHQESDKKENIEFPVYGKGCGLRKWTSREEKAFAEKSLQPYQQRIQKVLLNNKNIRVVSISLGYKKNWILEDNSKCDSKYVDLEYKILKQSWQSLLRKNPNTLFIVAAGNEGEDFNQDKFKKNDLWADLNNEPNLLLVGSLKVTKERLDSSNYGTKVIMVKGEQIEALSPLPNNEQKGHVTTLRGTSFSAPIIAGLAVKAINANPKISLSELKNKITENAKLID